MLRLEKKGEKSGGKCGRTKGVTASSHEANTNDF